VPQDAVSLQANIESTSGVYLRANTYIASKIFLNDANSATAKPYQLIGARIGFEFRVHSKAKLNLYTGVDNILDQTYSLGNDINAAAGRYYNAAPARNYYFGLGFSFK